jgi:hypothetical protein
MMESISGGWEALRRMGSISGGWELGSTSGGWEVFQEDGKYFRRMGSNSGGKTRKENMEESAKGRGRLQG